MFDFLTEEQRKYFEGMDDTAKEALKTTILTHFTGLTETALKDAKAKWESEDLPKAQEAAVNNYKSEAEKQAKAAADAEAAELAEILNKPENIKNIKRLFNNIENPDSYAKFLEKNGLDKNPKVAKLLSELGQRWEQEQRPAGDPNPPAIDTKGMTPAQELIARRNKEKKQ